MASSLQTKLRIAGSVLFASGFFDAMAGRFLWEPRHSPANKASDIPLPEYDVRSGALHVHSTYSDGGGDIPTVMDGATEADVDFVLLTDHNTQQPKRDGWESRYNERPLLLIGTEVTVEHGAFLLALDMPSEWEPTKEQVPQCAVNEILEQGGLPLISLPFDVKHPWREWNITGCEGLEVVNLSTVARRHINFLSLFWLMPIFWTEGMPGAIRALLTRPDAALERWDSLTASNQESIGLGALDAHALMKIGSKKYPIPSYTDSLGVVTTHVLLPQGAWSDPETARTEIYHALRAGRCYIAYDALEEPRPFSYFAQNGTKIATMGERINRTNGRVQLTASSKPGTLLRLYFQGQVVAAGRESLYYEAVESGAYRIEVYLYAGHIGAFYSGIRPWLFTNPIYVD